MSQLQRNQDADTSELLSTKLAPPRLRSVLVPRDPLLARLDEGLDHKLTLISAPAGFGKTTLVSQWLSQRMRDEGRRMKGRQEFHLSSFSLHPSKVAWLSLDAGENDPVRFWRYVLTACQAFQPDLGQPALALLRTSPQLPFEALLTMFINELNRLSGRYVLVLEDYHVITSPQIHETLTFLLDHLPPTLHLILLARSDPPLPLARLRARGELNELGAADLRFSLSETQAFLQQALPFPLSPETVERLDSRTEGWAAGLRLVALTLQGQKEPGKLEQFFDTFTGSHRSILEYLIADVFSVQPEPLQEFLLQTSVLIRLTGSLCEAITGRSDSALILEQLERANLFLLPLDAAGQWYRYHALFAEAMQHYARRQLGEAGLRVLYDKASLWYEQQGHFAEAIEAALSAQGFDRTAALIERLIEFHHLNNNELHTLRRWIEHLPEALLRSHPALCFTYAVTILLTEDRRAPATVALLQTPLEMAEQYWRAEENWPKLGEVLAFRSLVAWWQGDLAQTFNAARQALELLPEDELMWRGVSLVSVGMEELFAGKLDAARQHSLKAQALSEAANNIHGMLAAMFILGEVYFRQGELHQAAQLYRQVLTVVGKVVEVGEPLEDRSGVLTRLAGLAYEWNDLEQAEQDASQALDLGQRLAIEELRVHSSLVLARVQHARGEITQAQQLLHSLIAQTKRPLLLREVRAGQAQLALAAGDMAAVQQWATNYVQPDDDVPFIQQEREALIVARMLIAQEETEAALRLLERWQAEAHARGRGRSELEILILTALAHFSQQNLTQARQTLLEALVLAQPEGYQRLFLDEGKPMATLLQAALPEVNEPSLEAYVRTLLLAFTKDEGGRRKDEIKSQTLHPSSFILHPLIEPLSLQEQRVLRLLAAGLTNPEIAQELVVSLNTVKTQVKSIYHKLDVHSREEASYVAHQLNLL